MTMGPIVALLLAAGRGSRFDPTGAQLKLLQETGGRSLAENAALNLRAAGMEVIAIVRPADTPDQHKLHGLLARAGCMIVVNPRASEGIGASLALGARHAREAAGCIVALADEPAVLPATIIAIADALRAGHLTVAPTCQGRRGHPVGFARSLFGELEALSGDIGARDVLQRHPPLLIDVDDPGIHYDIDTPDDLGRRPAGR